MGCDWACHGGGCDWAVVTVIAVIGGCWRDFGFAEFRAQSCCRGDTLLILCRRVIL